MQAIADTIDLDLDVVAECSSFYVREMLAHLGSRTAEQRFKAQVARLAPKLAAYMATIVGGEIRYYGMGEGEGLTCGCHCQDCHYDNSDSYWCATPCECEDDDVCGHYYICEWCSDGGDGYEESSTVEHNVSACGEEEPGAEITPSVDDWNVSDDMLTFLERYGNGNGNGRKDAWHGWHKWQRNGGDIVKMLDEASKMFTHDGMWGGSYGGEGWATIAKLTRDYYSGKVKPATFVDRVWSVEHNGGNAFDKGYGDAAYRLANVLQVQYRNEYDKLCAYVDHETRAMWQTRTRKTARVFDGYTVIAEFHADRDPAWLGVQATNEEVW